MTKNLKHPSRDLRNNMTDVEQLLMAEVDGRKHIFGITVLLAKTTSKFYCGFLLSRSKFSD